MTTTVRRPAGVDLAVPAPRRPGTAQRPATIGVLSTYPPTQCGLATFSAALTEQLNLSPGTAGVVRIVDQPEHCSRGEIAAHLVNGTAGSVAAAVRRLNGFEAVVVQHEYGIYGGPDGCDVIDIVVGLTVPTIIVCTPCCRSPPRGSGASSAGSSNRRTSR